MASIEKRQYRNGVRYVMNVYVGRDPDTGKRRFITESFDRKKEAQARARELEGQKDQGRLVRPSKQTLAEYLGEWLEVKAGEVTNRTIHDYRERLRLYGMEPREGMPNIRRIQLGHLAPESFEGLYNHLWKERQLSPRSIRYVHTLLRQALGEAVRKKLVPSNPTDFVKVPKRPWQEDEEEEETTVNAMSEEEVGRFQEAARKDRYHALWLLLVSTGLRPGEALGLKWTDVDFDKSRLHVRRALARIGVDPEKHPRGWRLVKPKTKRSRRSVPLPRKTLAALREWKAVQARERLRLGSEWEDTGLIFTSERGTPLDQVNLYSRNFQKVMRGAELGEFGPTPKKPPRGPTPKPPFKSRLRMYDLRHTHATLLLKTGVAAKVVSERLGHAKINLTLDTYSHVLPDMQKPAVEAMDEILDTGS